MLDDDQLIRRVVDGQTEYFRVLVERYQGALFGLIRNLIADAHECEDLAQDTLLAAYRNLNRYDPHRARFPTWLLTIARNKCLNALKQRKPIALETIPEQAESREREVDQEDALRGFDAALARLPFEQKSAFVLSEIQGLTYQEISQIEQVSLGTIKSRISRAKGKLRCLVTHPSEQV
jgi:RNA polymerase sigma-70 factor (ECF subfamily)